MIAEMSDTNANSQFSFAMLTAAGDSDKPMRMITGPMTTGGNRRSRSLRPCHLMRADMMKYTSATPEMAAIVPGMPHSLEAEMIGAMKAKLEPKKMGTCPLVTRWKISVPIPAVNRAVAGSRPTSSGTSTVEPKATNRNWIPTIVFLEADNS